MVLADQPQVGLMHQGSGLESLARRFRIQHPGGQAAKLRVDQRQQLVRRVRVVLLDRLQELGDLVHHP